MKRAVTVLCKLVEVVHKVELRGGAEGARPTLRTTAEYDAAVIKLSLK